MHCIYPDKFALFGLYPIWPTKNNVTVDVVLNRNGPVLAVMDALAYVLVDPAKNGDVPATPVVRLNEAVTDDMTVPPPGNPITDAWHSQCPAVIDLDVMLVVIPVPGPTNVLLAASTSPT